MCMYVCVVVFFSLLYITAANVTHIPLIELFFLYFLLIASIFLSQFTNANITINCVYESVYSRKNLISMEL